jgi:hypothetical protein
MPSPGRRAEAFAHSGRPGGGRRLTIARTTRSSSDDKPHSRTWPDASVAPRARNSCPAPRCNASVASGRTSVIARHVGPGSDVADSPPCAGEASMKTLPGLRKGSCIDLGQCALRHGGDLARGDTARGSPPPTASAVLVHCHNQESAPCSYHRNVDKLIRGISYIMFPIC